MTKRAKTIALMGLGLILAAISWQLLSNEPSSPTFHQLAQLLPPPDRIVHFPDDQFLGSLWIADWGLLKSGLHHRHASQPKTDHPAVLMGKAQGEVALPAAKALILVVSSDLGSLSPIADLNADDLQEVYIMGGEAGGSVEENRFDLDDLSYLHKLTGLRHLAILDDRLFDHHLKLLKSMQFLETLQLYSSNLSDDGREYLEKALPNCRIIYNNPGYQAKQPTQRRPVS